MAHEVELFVPLPPDQAAALLVRAAEALRHQVARHEPAIGFVELHVDFRLRGLATFRVLAHLHPHETGRTRMTLDVRPAFRLMPFTGFGGRQQVAWELVGAMQRLHDPEEYERLERVGAAPGAGQRSR
jgi:hypothetical protein